MTEGASTMTTAIDGEAGTATTTDEELLTLISRAGQGDQVAWRRLHQRFAALISRTARKTGLGASEVDDVSQTVWLRLVLSLKDLREPRALAGWIVTTTRRESLRVLISGKQTEPTDPTIHSRLHQVDTTEPDENLRRAEQYEALRAGIGALRPRYRQLFELLLADPQLPYSEISSRLGIPHGSIGPTRARCLNELRAAPAIQAFLPESADAA
jgi:RNA polymerase sigma factor (sigma-70 family)